MRRPSASAVTRVRSAFAVRPERPITRPRSSGCTRTSSRSPRGVERSETWTWSGLSTIPLTRCSSASASTGLLGALVGGRGGLGRGGGRSRSLGLRPEHRLLLLVDDERGLRLLGADRAHGARVALELAPVTRELEERRDLLGRLRADAEPVLGALRVDLDERGLLGRVVLADLLDHTTVALGARVGDDDAVVGRADLAEALQTDLDSHNSPVCV